MNKFNELYESIMNEGSVGGSIWKSSFSTPYVVKATKGNTKNEIVGKFKELKDAKKEAKKWKDAKIYNNTSGEIVEMNEGGKYYKIQD